MRLFATASLAAVLTACGGGAPEPVMDVADMTLEQRGRVVFAKCRTCHSLDEGGRHKVGPNLWGVFGREAGTREGFAYSKAMRGSGIVWDDASMDDYLRKPAEVVKGTRMTFVGLKQQADREAVIAYLHEQTE